MRYSLFTVFAALSLAVSMPARAQRGPGAAPSHGPGWLARVSFLDNPDQTVPVTAAERASVAARLAAIEAEFLRIAAIDRPQGFEAKAAFGWNGGQFTVRDQLIGQLVLARVRSAIVRESRRTRAADRRVREPLWQDACARSGCAARGR